MAIRRGWVLACLVLGATQGQAFLGIFKKEKIVKAEAVEESAPLTVRASSGPVRWSLEDSSSTFSMTSSGTSCYAVINVGGKAVGAFLPHNSATNPNTEAAYGGLAKLLGIGAQFQYGTPVALGSGGIAKFRALINQKRGSLATARLKNCQNLEAKMNASPNRLVGVYKDWQSAKPEGYEDFVNYKGGKNGEPRMGHAVMQALQSGNPWPSDQVVLTYGKGYRARLTDIAAAHGVTMMFDALFGQWDRYSGGNVTVGLNAANQSFYIFTADNGGASVTSSTWTEKHVTWMTRYPLEIVQAFAEMELFLAGKQASFAGYSDPLAFVQGIGLVYDLSPDAYRKHLLRNLSVIRQKVEAQVKQSGSSRAYYRLR